MYNQELIGSSFANLINPWLNTFYCFNQKSACKTELVKIHVTENYKSIIIARSIVRINHSQLMCVCIASSISMQDEESNFRP